VANEGWYWGYPNPKRHYFVKGKSLCGKVESLGGDMRPESHDNSNNCPECVKRAGKRNPSDVLSETVLNKPDNPDADSILALFDE
jgi:hypothetical protein